MPEHPDHQEAPALIDTRGHPITERRLRAGMRTNIVAGSLGMAWVAVALGMPVTMFMDAIGASGVMIGLAATVQQFAMLFQVPAAFIAEMLPARKSFWGIFALLHRACWFFPAFLPFLLRDRPQLMAFILVIVLAVSSVLGQIATPAWYSWMSDLIPERLRSKFWALRQSISMIPFLAVMVLSGWVLDIFGDPRQSGGSFLGFGLVFGVAGVLGCLDIIIHFGVPEPRTTPIRFEPRKLVERLIAPLREVDFRWLTLSMCVLTFALSMTGQFSLLALKRLYGFTYIDIALLGVAASLGVILAGFMWGYVMDRVGARNFGVLSIILGPACGVVWFFLTTDPVTIQVPVYGPLTVPQALLLQLAGSFVGGAIFSGAGLSQISLLGALAPPQGRTMAMAVHWALIGVTAAFGPLAGGWFMDLVTAHPLRWTLPTGVPVNFFHILVIAQIALCWFLAVPLLLKVNRRRGEMTFHTAFMRTVTLNPVRMVLSAYNIYSMGASDSRGTRATAARKLGEEKTALAVADLVAHLDDPSLEVREEAALALGSIGSPDALDALLLRLDEPACELVPEIARALRQEQTRQALGNILRRITLPIAELLTQVSPQVSLEHRRRMETALVRHLATSERETACEIVRTLGVVGGQEIAGPALLELLRSTRDRKLVIACSEALVRLEQSSAAFELLARVKTDPDPRFNRALIVNLGDLIGKPGGFYRLLAHEERKRGSEVEELLADLGKTVADAGRASPDYQEEARRAVAAIKALDVAYVEGQMTECARLLFDIGALLVTLNLHLPPHSSEDFGAWMEVLLSRSEHTGFGMWYLKLLRDALERPDATPPDATDVLLGIYFLGG